MRFAWLAVLASVWLCACRDWDAALGECTDTQTDPQNCGACGHHCQGGECRGGACVPFTIAQENAFAIVADEAAVYWTSRMDGNVRRFDLASEAVTSIATAQAEPSVIAVDDTYVYWASDVALEIRSVVKDGSDPEVEVVASGLEGPALELTTSEDYVVWTVDDTFPEPDEVRRISKTEFMPSVELMTTNIGAPDGYDLVSPTGVVADAEAIYCATGFGDGNGPGLEGAILRIPLRFDDVNLYASSNNESSPLRLAMDAESLYWTDRFEFGEVRTVPKTGGDMAIVAGGYLDPAAIVVDGERLVFTALDEGLILGVAKTGGEVTTFAEGERGPTSIAATSGSLFWVAQETGEVRRLAK